MHRILPLLLAVAGGQAGSTDKPEMTRKETEALAESPRCSKVKTGDARCLRLAFEDEADAYLFGSADTLVQEMAGRWSVELPEVSALKGVRMPRETSAAKECVDALKSSEDKDCVGALIISDLSHWLRKEPSIFGDCVQDALNHFRQYRSDTGFQKTRWGMTSAEVTKRLPGLKAEGGQDRSGKTVVAEFPARVLFRFVEDRLWSVEVSFAVDSTMPERDVRRTADLRKLLTSKYGDPETHDGSSSGEGILMDELLQAIGGTGRAVRSGKMMLNAKWTQGDMTVELTLGAPDGEYVHRLVYTSTVLAGRAESQREDRRASEL